MGGKAAAGHRYNVVIHRYNVSNMRVAAMFAYALLFLVNESADRLNPISIQDSMVRGVEERMAGHCGWIKKESVGTVTINRVLIPGFPSSLMEIPVIPRISLAGKRDSCPCQVR